MTVSADFKIAFGVTAYQKMLPTGLDGIGIYTSGLFRSLNKIHPEIIKGVSFGWLNDDAMHTIDLGNFRPQLLKAAFLKRPFNSAELIKRNFKVFHATDHYIPRLKKLPVVATIHDAIPFSHPQWFDHRRRAYHKLLRVSMKWASEIITVSEYSKKQIQKFVGIDPSRISVVPNGVDSGWFVRFDNATLEKIKTKHGIVGPYILFVGTIQKRKNLSLLLDAVNLMGKNFQKQFSVVIVGKSSPFEPEEHERLVKARQANLVHWCGSVDANEIKQLVKGAELLAFPSLAEGFGLPILESFAAGTPVVALRNTSIPEVAGDAAYLVDSNDASLFANAIGHILSDKQLARKLVLDGLSRAKEFSWHRTAKRTMDVYKSFQE